MSNSAPLIPDSSVPWSQPALPPPAAPSEIFAPRSVRAPALKPFYIPELDCLRFLAFFGVFVFHTRSYLPHAGLPYRLESLIHSASGIGAFGVDLFFVLSAFLITELLLREKQATGGLNVSAFYLRRILRIWPLYFFFLGIASLLPLLDPNEHPGWKYLLGFGLLSGNWITILWGVPNSIVTPLWSISMEEQFYLFWPPVVKRLSAKGLAAAAIVMLVGSNVIRMLLYVFVHPRNQTIWFNTFTRLDPIAFGILLALLLRVKPIRLTGFRRLFLAGVSLAALLTASEYANLNLNMDFISRVGLFSYPLIALGCAGILLAMLGVQNWPTRNAGMIYLDRKSVV